MVAPLAAGHAAAAGQTCTKYTMVYHYVNEVMLYGNWAAMKQGDFTVSGTVCYYGGQVNSVTSATVKLTGNQPLNGYLPTASYSSSRAGLGNIIYWNACGRTLYDYAWMYVDGQGTASSNLFKISYSYVTADCGTSRIGARLTSITKG